MLNSGESLNDTKIKVMHIITSLSTGGAESALHKLISTMDQSRFHNIVVSLTDVGSVGETMKCEGVMVFSIGMNQKFVNPVLIRRLYSIVGLHKPDIIQTWMYHADFIGGLVGKFSKIPVIWNIRHTDLTHSLKMSTYLVAKTCSYLSSLIPCKIICCSESAKRTHSVFGYDISKIQVIPNGFDLAKFNMADKTERVRFRSAIGIATDTILIGGVGRYHPVKDYGNFIRAAGILANRHSNVAFVLCGQGLSWDNKDLVRTLQANNVDRKFFLLGKCDNVPQIMAGLDIFTSSSSSEGFPNVVGEAMACGIPCVVTNVGDSSLIVGSTGKIVPPKDSESMAKAWCELIVAGEKYRHSLGIAARKRIENNYCLPATTKRYESVYKEVFSKCVE